MYLFFIVFFVVYVIANYYVLRRSSQALEILPNSIRLVFIVSIVIASLSYFISRALQANSKVFLYDFFITLGAFWFAVLMYAILFLLVIDISRFIIKKYRIFPKLFLDSYKTTKLKTFAVVSLLTISIVGYGYCNARNINTKTFEITLPKGEGNLDKLNLVFFSDSHLSPINDGKFTDDLVERINQLNPDIILSAGDIIDDKPENINRYNISERLRKLSSKYGTFTCNGNHEYIVGIKAAQDYLKESKIAVIRDSVITIANSVQIIGRDDLSKSRFIYAGRKSLKELVAITDSKLPVILLDHQPFNLDSTSFYGIDLHLSGHTHHGQMFPASIITKMIYEISWGFEQRGKTHYYVSSGVGTWGPPVRLGSDSEIIQFKISFK